MKKVIIYLKIKQKIPNQRKFYKNSENSKGISEKGYGKLHQFKIHQVPGKILQEINAWNAAC